MKKILISSVVFACNLVSAANVVELKISAKDFSNYKVKAEAYSFTESAVSINGHELLAIPEMETRGQSSIAAPRRNFGLKLDTKIQLGSIDTKNINLLSMWIDKGYISSKFGLMVVEKLKIGAPILNEYTELRINGKTNGLYLMVEKPKSAAGSTPYMVRRAYKSRFKSKEAKIGKSVTPDEVKKIEHVRDSIYSVLDKKSGPELFADLQQKMDIESYMKWMVMNSLFRNGDGPDEVFFYVDSKIYKSGSIYFRIMPWDFDDLFKSMHSVSINQTEIDKNPNSIIYNFEDKLDYRFAHDPYLYSQLQSMTKNLLTTELSQANTNALLDTLQQQISPFLERTDILEMGRVDAGRKGQPYTKTEILETIARRKLEIEKRRSWLLHRTGSN